MILKKGQKVWVEFPLELGGARYSLATVMDPRGRRPLVRYGSGWGQLMERRFVLPYRPRPTVSLASFHIPPIHVNCRCAIEGLNSYHYPKGGPA